MIDIANKPLEGYFKIEALKDGNVIDSFEDHNTICINARLAMAKIFSQIYENNSSKYACKLVLGTCGHTKTTFTARVDGVSYNRDIKSLYAEQYVRDDITSYVQQTADVLTPYKIYHHNGEYYRYLNPDNASSYIINDDLLSNSNVFQKDYEPYVYSVGFNILNKTYHSANLGYKMQVESSKPKCEAYVSIENTLDATDVNGQLLDDFKSTVKFTWIIPKNYANSQVAASEYGTRLSLFSEAGLYVDDEYLFCYRAFPCKVKDPSTSLRITWKIIF